MTNLSAHVDPIAAFLLGVVVMALIIGGCVLLGCYWIVQAIDELDGDVHEEPAK